MFCLFIKAWSSALFFFPPQEELEHLNEASAEINRLELQLDVSNNTLSTQFGTFVQSPYT